MTVVRKEIADTACVTEQARFASTGVDRLLSAKSARKLLDISERGLRRWVAAGMFPQADLHIGRNLRWRESTVREFINGSGRQ